ncbi:MAG: N-6 DNA methylase [Nitrospirae bacterium]|nr:N-6 DNA methylase [Nitrospirota bacterium]
MFEGLAAGFIHFRKTELGITQETDESKREIFKGCLTLLYRLLFILYAESRNLLPASEDGYYKVSLSKVKKDIFEDLKTTKTGKMSTRSYVYWARFQSLFDIVAKGDPALNVPIYNGGLFETPANGFLAGHKMPDPFLADAVEQLTVDHESDTPPNPPLAKGGRQGGVGFIDYSSLNVRHLGDIYEGLLEFHIQIAETEIVESREKGKSVWKKLAEIKAGTKTYRTKKAGEVYIENSKHERKATGSYYTPHYIVEYIVKNTVGPVLHEKLKAAASLLAELDEAAKALRRQKTTAGIQGYRTRVVELENRIFDTLFDVKVLDPAMGSGHFLVHTVDCISDGIIAFLADYPENPVLKKIAGMKAAILAEVERQGVRIDESRLTEVNLIKRMVMKRCIYGVDLNDMAVELAKLSLWLDSFTLGAPLSFLDHHLKCGNSLVGTNINELEKALSGHLFAVNLEPLKRAIRDMIFVSDLPDATFAQVKESYEKFGEANKGLEGYRVLLDMLVAEYFGVADSKKLLVSDFDRIDLNRLHESLKALPTKDRKAIEDVERVSQEKLFFHWEIEFPEVFYERTGEFEQKIGKKENPGFDCVIGNPPYDVVSELEQDKDVEPEKKFFKSIAFYAPAVGGKLNFYRLFSALAVHYLRDAGMHGFIVPMALLADKQAKALRQFMLKNYYLQQIEAFPQKDDPANRIFKEAKLSTCIYLLRKSAPDHLTVRIHPGKDILESSVSLKMKPPLIEEFDEENLSIPSHPSMSARDFHLALKLKKMSNGNCLKEIALSQQGEVNLTEHAKFFSDKEKGKIVLRGAHVNRYDFQEEPKQGEPVYLDVDKFLHAHGKDTKAYDHRYLRIGYQRGSAIDNWRRIIATIIEKDNFCSDTINYIVNPKDYDLYAVLALLNSLLWEWRFRLTSTNNHVNAYEIDSMPMPPIFFTTPEKERKERVAEAIKLYWSDLGAVAFEAGKWQNKREDKNHDKSADKKGTGKSRKVAGAPRGYELSEGGVSGEDTGLGGEVHGVREGAGEYDPSEGASGEGESSTRPVDSTRRNLG